MKIILSPSKTKNLDEKYRCEKNILFNEKTNYLIKILQNTDLSKLYKSKDLKEKYEKIYYNFKDISYYKGFYTYQGLVFKNLKIQEIEKNLDKICILSALFGIVDINTSIFDYRLDLVDNILKETEFKNMYNFWYEDINKYFEKEDLIINLASDEYSKLIKNKNMYTLEFHILNKNNKLVKQSTDSKIKRGLFANYILKNNINSVDEITKIRINHTIFNKIEDNKIIFIN